VHAPIALDASEPVWPIVSADGIICINMIHISPWEATLGLIKGAAAILPPGAPLYLYGPYLRQGIVTAPTKRSIRSESSRSQSGLGSARPRRGRRDGAFCWILGSGYHRNAGEQSERGVPTDLTGPWRAIRSHLRFSRLPHLCGRPRGSQLCVPFPSHRPDIGTAQC
jgi:hypothetical protein